MKLNGQTALEYSSRNIPKTLYKRNTYLHEEILKYELSSIMSSVTRNYREIKTEHKQKIEVLSNKASASASCIDLCVGLSTA